MATCGIEGMVLLKTHQHTPEESVGVNHHPAVIIRINGSISNSSWTFRVRFTPSIYGIIKSTRRTSNSAYLNFSRASTPSPIT
jgi:hypothetical protein